MRVDKIQKTVYEFEIDQAATQGLVELLRKHLDDMVIDGSFGPDEAVSLTELVEMLASALSE
jgi:hypothetical protein